MEHFETSEGYCGGLYDSKVKIKHKRMDNYLVAPTVIVFKNVFEDPDRVMSIIRKSQDGSDPYFGEWEDWFPWGILKGLNPDDKGLESNTSDGAYVLKEIKKAFWDAVAIYKEKYIDLDYIKRLGSSPNLPTKESEVPGTGWGCADILILDYNETNESTTTVIDGTEYTMLHHTDRAPWLGATSHAYTLTVYPNDDYKGGELSFVNMDTSKDKEYTNENGETFKYKLIDQPIIYKPEAGDIIMFRSDLYHGVFPITQGHKFFIRCFLTTDFPPEYYAEKNKHTEEEWGKIIADTREVGFRNGANMVSIFKKKEDLVKDRDLNLCVIRSENEE